MIRLEIRNYKYYNRKAAKISALPSKKFNKYEYFADEET